MITLYNQNTVNPFSVQYVVGSKVFRKEIIPGYMMGFRGLTGLTQVVNLCALTGESVTVYDFIGNTYINQGSLFQTGYRGFVVFSGLTFTTAILTAPTGYTFITSASTATTQANNTAVSNTVELSAYTMFSGSPPTTVFVAALQATAFSGWGVTYVGQSTSSSAATASIVFLSSSTVSTTAANNLYAGDNVKREAVLLTTANNFSATTALTTLRALVTGSTS